MGSSELGANSSRTELEHGARAHLRSWTIVLAAGLVAGVLAWVAGELTHGFFRPRRYSVEIMGMVSMQPSKESRRAADIANATLSSAILGSVAALTMGLAGGLIVHTPLRGAIIGLGAQALGAFAGAAASLALIPILYWELVPDSNDLLTPIMIHGGIWSAIGAVCAMAFAAGMSRWRQLPLAILFAGTGASTASVIFHLLTGILFPGSSSAEAVGGSAVVRLLATSLVTVLVAIGVGRGTLGRVPHPADSVSTA
jgi:hypothetical protein